MALFSSDPSAALHEKKESQGLVSIQSMVTRPDEEEIFGYSSMVCSSPNESEDDYSEGFLDDHMERFNSESPYENNESVSEQSSVEDEDHENHCESDLPDIQNLSMRSTCDRSTSVVSDISEDGARDSGIEIEREVELYPMLIPDQDLMEKITAQVEFYFGDANVVKDKFLLKHIRRNKEGYVSLKLVSSFKKVKQLTKDWRVVAFSLEKISTTIQINDQRTKIRRTEPLPEIDDSPITCAVLALDLPLEKPSVESVSRLFSSIGDIAFIRVLRAGGNLPPDVKSLLTKYPILGIKHCAWIEFETPEAAKAAVDLSEEGGMRVNLIVPESQKKQERNKHKKQKNEKKMSVNYNKNFPMKKNSFSSPNNGFNNYNMNYNYSSSNNYYRQRRDSSYRYEERRLPGQQRRKAISLPSNQNPFIEDIYKRHEAKLVKPKSKSCPDYNTSGSPPHSWVQRHLLAAAAASAASAASPVIGSRPPSTRLSRSSTGTLPLSEAVIRLPKGPDGSKGFARNLGQISETY